MERADFEAIHPYHEKLVVFVKAKDLNRYRLYDDRQTFDRKITVIEGTLGAKTLRFERNDLDNSASVFPLLEIMTEALLMDIGRRRGCRRAVMTEIIERSTGNFREALEKHVALIEAANVVVEYLRSANIFHMNQRELVLLYEINKQADLYGKVAPDKAAHAIARLMGRLTGPAVGTWERLFVSSGAYSVYRRLSNAGDD